MIGSDAEEAAGSCGGRGRQDAMATLGLSFMKIPDKISKSGHECPKHRMGMKPTLSGAMACSEGNRPDVEVSCFRRAVSSHVDGWRQGVVPNHTPVAMAGCDDEEEMP